MRSALGATPMGWPSAYFSPTASRSSMRPNYIVSWQLGPLMWSGMRAEVDSVDDRHHLLHPRAEVPQRLELGLCDHRVSRLARRIAIVGEIEDVIWKLPDAHQG